MNNRLLVASFAGLSLTLGVFAQQPQQPAASGTQRQQEQSAHKNLDDVVRISVTLVQVDVSVNDKKSRPVTDLRTQDFEIYEDGRRQQITNFSYISPERFAATEASPPAQSLIAKNAPLPPPVRLRPEQVRRTIALVVDDLTLTVESAPFVRQALKKFVDEQMQPGDLVAIIRTGA